MSVQATSSQAMGEPKEWIERTTRALLESGKGFQPIEPIDTSNPPQGKGAPQVVGHFNYTPYPYQPYQPYQPHSPSLTSDPVCHRCGKPSGWSYLNSLPTCAWCLAELNAKQSYEITTTSTSEPHYHYVIPDSEQFFVRVKYAVEGMEPLEYIGEGVSDWVDLRAARSFKYGVGERFLIPLGVAIELPKGYEALVAPRSSTFKKYGIIQTNSLGVIDEAYCGDGDEWKWPVYALRAGEIKKNDRLCQFRIIKHQPKLIFQEVDHLGNDDRSGFGSTGHQ